MSALRCSRIGPLSSVQQFLLSSRVIAMEAALARLAASASHLAKLLREPAYPGRDL